MVFWLIIRVMKIGRLLVDVQYFIKFLSALDHVESPGCVIWLFHSEIAGIVWRWW